MSEPPCVGFPRVKTPEIRPRFAPRPIFLIAGYAAPPLW
jgi:hypothetical protein